MDTLLGVLKSFVGGGEAWWFIGLAAAAVFALSMGVIALAAGASDPIRRRLSQMSEGPQEGSVAEMLTSLLRPLAAIVIPRKAWDRDRVSRLLVHAGYRSPSATTLFYGAKATAIAALPLIVMAMSPLIPQLSTAKIVVYAIASGALGAIVCSMWLDRAVERRQRDLRQAFPDALDLLVVCVESGLGLSAALQRVADEMLVNQPALGEELALVNAEIRAGVDRGQALKNLADRTGLQDIRGLTALLVQTMRFGTSVADALRVYSDEFRDKRTQAAEEQAAKISTKMIFPLVLCLFPSFFLVAIGPAIIGLIEAFGTMG
jgi:tight adherence protein C